MRPTVQASEVADLAAAISGSGRHQALDQRSVTLEGAAKLGQGRPTRVQHEARDPLLTTDPALSDTASNLRREAVAKVPDLGAELAHRDPEASRVRLIGGKQIPGTRYRLVRWLGEGGMGVVYEAEHIDIERRVAMKVLRLDLSLSPDIARVFRDEARAANRVGSRHIVQIHDFGELPDGRLYFCMELLAGVDLTARKDEGFDPGELIGVLRQVCKGLGAAHAAGIVHRDIKPENILLVDEEGKKGLVKIVDFGVAAILGGDGSSPIAGTPHYMSPEQIMGGDFDGRLDLYSVGCMAYELLVSHPPFDGETLEEVLMGQLNDPPMPPSQVRPDRTIPPALEAVILRCLEKKPEDRYASMAELEAALCEAQIAAGLHSAWDDLPLPEVDPERKAWLAANMPSLHEGLGRRRPRWFWPLVAGLAVLLSVGATAAVMASQTPAAVVSEVDRLTDEARKAAIASHWVVPEGDEVTAYQRVREIETLGEDLSQERGKELRGEFASALVKLGDQLWPTEEARTLATLYYGWAVTFEPTNSHARERSLLTDAEIALARERANKGDFFEGERELAMIARAAVSEDPEEKKALLAEAFKRDRPRSALRTAFLADSVRAAHIVDEEDFDEIARSSGLAGAGAAADAGAASGGGAGESGDGEDDVVEIEPDDPQTGKPGRKSGKNGKRGSNGNSNSGEEAELEKAEKDPAKSDSLVEQGRAALRSGNRSEAETLFHQALAHNSRNTAALAGLSDVYFDRGAYQKAVIYGERAVKLAADDKSLRIKLGDAYFGVLRYNDALKQYEKAGELGESRAAARIAKVKAKLGEG
ncbi:MAG: protein kinase [Myxococcales bacterium]|nr:protein kinase [Myxococcales bacterium]